MSNVIEKIKKIYPDGVVVGLRQQHQALYDYLCLESRNNGFDKIEDYLAVFGLIYVTKPCENKIDQDGLVFAEKIGELYDGKVIRDLATNHPVLYRELHAYTKANDISIREFLQQTGFSYKGDCSNIDVHCCKKLNSKFDISWAELSRLSDVSRQRMDQAVNGQIVNEDCWTNKKLTDEEKEIIEIMIEDEITSFESDDLKIIIINNCAGDVAIILKNENNIKCFFYEEIPDEILSAIKEKRMDHLLQVDFDVLKNCKKVYVMKTPCLSTDGCFHLISRGKRAHKMNTKEYMKLLGVDKFVSSKDKTDDDFIKFFEEHLIDGEVYISASPENQWIRSYASRAAKMSIDEFVEFFGYKKAVYDYTSRFEETKRKYNILLKEYLVDGSNTDIDIANDPRILNNLYSLARIHHLTLDELLLEFGYKRMNFKEIDIHETVEELYERFEDNRSIRGEYDITRIQRNKQLVSELKSLYNFKCQICGDNDTYSIKQSNGTNYVEVHHIKPLSESCENEECELDVMSNMIVVCPHHHKVLHFQNNGYFNLSFKDGLSITNNNNESIPVVLDYHLRKSL